MMQGTLKTLNRCGVKLSVHLTQAQRLALVGLGFGLVLSGQWLGEKAGTSNVIFV